MSEQLHVTGFSEYDLKDILLQPIPDQTGPLALKDGYRSLPLWEGHPRNAESVVDIAEYGIAGQNYYSRPNAATGGAVEGVVSAIYLRESIAKRLSDINTALQQMEVATQLLGGEVELYVEDGLRSRNTQGYLHGTLFPELIRSQNPGISDDDMFARRDQLIAAPRQEGASPSPHECGAVDVTLRYVRPDRGYIAKSLVYMGHEDGSSAETARPDYYENLATLSAKDQIAQRNRRIFYWIMRGALLRDGDSRLVCNPTEYWHWSYGDQMWAALTRAPYAFYGAQEIPQFH